MKSRSPQTVPDDGVGLLIGKRRIHVQLSIDTVHEVESSGTPCPGPVSSCGRTGENTEHGMKEMFRRPASSPCISRRPRALGSPRPRRQHTHGSCSVHPSTLSTVARLRMALFPPSGYSPGWRLRISAAEISAWSHSHHGMGTRGRPASSKFPFVVSFVVPSIRTPGSWLMALLLSSARALEL